MQDSTGKIKYVSLFSGVSLEMVLNIFAKYNYC